ncbi:MAG: hypothetical protein J5701_01675 [Bacteroidales bacterium]|nr:hypothetical protein [Bacteroidales bacterium]
MKRLVLTLTLVLGIAATMIAQPRAIGGRLGNPIEFSYQHGIGSGFLEIDAGAFFYPALGVEAAVVYDWIFASPNWTPKGTWDWYAGVGGAGGFGFREHWHHKDPEHVDHSWYYTGVAGQIGLSYTFWFPLQLSVDFRPTIGPAFYYDYEYGHYRPTFNAWGFFNFAIGVRYSFGN